MDIIWFKPDEKHWHGATPTTSMTHITIVEKLGGKSADWMEKVSDEQCHANPFIVFNISIPIGD